MRNRRVLEPTAAGPAGRRRIGAPALALLLSACAPSGTDLLLGSLEWDRASVAAEVSEPILRVAVAEGDAVHAGDLILELDSRRTDAELAQARAEVARAAAQLREQRHGARPETLDALRAEAARAGAEARNAAAEQQRSAQMARDGVVSHSVDDRAAATARAAEAAERGARARLDELLHGTRLEQIEQAEAALAAAQARAEGLSLKRERLTVRAPRDGRIDALPFKLGDQPPVAAPLVTLLVGNAPYARLYVPASQRARLASGAHCRLQVEGVAGTIGGTLRALRSDPAFTPYYALTGEDASRLSYRAEVLLEGPAAAALPAGLPLTASCDGATGR